MNIKFANTNRNAHDATANRKLPSKLFHGKRVSFEDSMFFARTEKTQESNIQTTIYALNQQQGSVILAKLKFSCQSNKRILCNSDNQFRSSEVDQLAINLSIGW